MNLTCTI